MEHQLEKLPPDLLIIIIIILGTILIIGFGLFAKWSHKYLDKIEKKLDMLFIEIDAANYASDKCMPSNGKSFKDHREEKRKELMERQNKIDGK